MTMVTGNWIARWRCVLLTDESRFSVSSCDRRVRVWRRQGERYADCNIVEHNRFGGGSLMFWGGICFDGRTDLHMFAGGTLTALRYRDEILDPIVRPFLAAMGNTSILMQDNARCHTANVVRAYFSEETIDVMDWPARSPDLNPIEHVWDMIYRRISHRDNPPRNVQELANAVVEVWNNLPQQQIQTLVQSMPNRCRECINARGGHTHY